MVFTRRPLRFCSRQLNRTQPSQLTVERLEARLCLSHWASPAVPEFSSLPGAKHTVFLDYNGHEVSGTGWNNYYNQSLLDAAPYDINGDPNTFNTTELARIEESWKRIAEDFFPFNINVTTVEPAPGALRKSGSGDDAWGVRAIVTKESNMVTDPDEYCRCGGIAYINSFNSSIDLPVWVYTSGGKSIAEAGSHEVGHALGLSHDGSPAGSYYRGHGSGENSWASIMGVGYSKNVTTWDKGEFYQSNNGGSGANYGRGPDDLKIITSFNGFDYRADDHGDSRTTATTLAVSGTNVSGSGVIETSGDVDVLSFTTGAGAVTLDITPFTPGPNLDVKAEIVNSDGDVVATSDNSSVLAASFSLDLPAGQYFVLVDGTGYGNPGANPPTGYSDYASLGRYSVSGTVQETASAPELSIADVTVNEGDGTATFAVSISGSFSDPVSVEYATANDSATAGLDYDAASDVLVFVPGGATTLDVTVDITDDGDAEGTEKFFVNLSNAPDATLTDPQAIGTILDNESSLVIDDVSIREGNSSRWRRHRRTFTNFDFTVTLSNPVGHSVSVDYKTVDGTATVINDDYLGRTGRVTFDPGETEKTITVRVRRDRVRELDETFTVELSGESGASLSDNTGVGTIKDDDTRGRRRKSQGIVADPFHFFEDTGDHSHDHNHNHDMNSDHNHDDTSNDSGVDKPNTDQSLELIIPIQASSSTHEARPDQDRESLDFLLESGDDLY